MLDPNDDGDFSDRADIANPSLGNEFGVFDETRTTVGSLYREGILSVVAAGNANNTTTPWRHLPNWAAGTSAYGLTVANSSARPAVDREDSRPANEADTYGDYSVNFDYSKATDGNCAAPWCVPPPATATAVKHSPKRKPPPEGQVGSHRLGGR